MNMHVEHVRGRGCVKMFWERVVAVDRTSSVFCIGVARGGGGVGGLALPLELVQKKFQS